MRITDALKARLDPANPIYTHVLSDETELEYEKLLAA